MKTLRYNVPVSAEGTVTVQLPLDVEPGATVTVAVTVDDNAPVPGHGPFTFANYDVDVIDPDFKFRREDLYPDEFDRTPENPR